MAINEMDAAGRLEAWQARCADATPPARLIGVSKRHDAAHVAPYLARGLRDLGENYVQEAIPKFARLREAGHCFAAHLIGPLQSNKAREAAETFDVIHTIDRPKIVAALESACAALEKRLDVFVQIDIGDEPQKSGVVIGELAVLIETVRAARHLNLVGLMAVPPERVPPAPYFALLAELASRHRLPRLSMGMSADAELALRFGATDIRIGTALFGARSRDAE